MSTRYCLMLALWGPMPLCDTLLRLAEEPAFYRPLWSELVLREVGVFLSKRGYGPTQVERRLNLMRAHFPEACVDVPPGLIDAFTCIPDPNDRHVLAAAVRGHGNSIITLNQRHFPAECLEQYDLLCQTPDEFLVHQFYLSPDLVLEKIDAQASATKQSRAQVTERLRNLCHAPDFAALIDRK